MPVDFAPVLERTRMGKACIFLWLLYSSYTVYCDWGHGKSCCNKEVKSLIFPAALLCLNLDLNKQIKSLLVQSTRLGTENSPFHLCLPAAQAPHSQPKLVVSDRMLGSI